MCTSVTFWGFVRDFEDEMGGFEKSTKTTRTPPHILFQTRTKAQTAAEAAAAGVASTETAAANTTDANTITCDKNFSKHQIGTPNPAISDPILVDLSFPGDSRSSTDERSVTVACVVTDYSSTMADVSPTVGVLQPTLLYETLLDLNEGGTQMDIYRQRIEQLEADHETNHSLRKINDVNSLKRYYNIAVPWRKTSRLSYGYATLK